jgi:predicted transcriptional regulator
MEPLIQSRRVAYIPDMIRALGLRHVVVVDSKHRALGMITRKDVMEWSLQCVLDGHRYDWTRVQDPGAVVG